MNYGLHWEREQQEIDGTEWEFGAISTPCLYAVPLDKRQQYLPTGELQNIGEEKFSCVTRAYLNDLETKFNYAAKNWIIQLENRTFLDQYRNDKGDIEFSDAFIAILSGTTRQGNSLKAPADAIRKCGLIPKKLLPQLDTFDADYDPLRISQTLRDLGGEFLRRFKINYEQVYYANIEEALKQDIPSFGLYAWPSPLNGEYPKTDGSYNHCVMAFAPATYIFDNYIDPVDGDFIKKLAADYNMTPYGYRIYVSQETNEADRGIPLTVFEILLKYGLLAFFAAFFAKYNRV